MANENQQATAAPEAKKPEALGVQSAPQVATPTVGLAEAKPSQTPAAAAPVKPPAPKVEEVKIVDSSDLLPGDKIIYWNTPQKANGKRKWFGFTTELTPCYGWVTEVHPAGVVHICFGVPGLIQHAAVEEVAKPVIGKFTRLAK